MNKTLMATLMLSLMLTSCASWRTPKIAPEPPRIDCSERSTVEPLPRRPNTRRWEHWAGYARRLLGVIEVERTQRAEVADCLDREREAGRIR